MVWLHYCTHRNLSRCIEPFWSKKKKDSCWKHFKTEINYTITLPANFLVKNSKELKIWGWHLHFTIPVTTLPNNGGDFPPIHTDTAT